MQISSHSNSRKTRQSSPAPQNTTLGIGHLDSEPLTKALAGTFAGSFAGAAIGACADGLGFRDMVTLAGGTFLVTGAVGGLMLGRHSKKAASEVLKATLLCGVASTALGTVALVSGRPLLAGTLIGGACGLAVGLAAKRS